LGTPEGRRPLERPWCKWEDNIKINLRVVGRRGMDWIDVAQNWGRWRADVNAVMNLWVPLNAANFLITSGLVSFSGRPLRSIEK
jgi:hypothetical protein